MILTIDNKEIQVDLPATVLDVAVQNDIYIPSLCAHPELVPYGGCRLCIVEIEGRNRYPTACTTQVEDKMIVRTNTKILQEMRTDLVQLILSEHPSACLLCEDIEGCSIFQGTIRKVGITTGCRWCPNDKDCELQRIVENLGIHELSLPGLYRDIPLEKYDPFFDRDYNLCIYCGRCVRICNEYRRSSVLSLKQRGNLTTIGPSFDATHIDANCEFCGACVSVCPTGAMSEKSRKWWGSPEKYEASVCPLCSLNCDIQVLAFKDKIVGTLPPGKPHESGGELCVKGRFCLSELVNRTERILEPQFKYNEGYGFVQWDTAIEKTSEIIRKIPPGRSAIFLSPSLSLEEIHTATIFAEKVLHSKVFSSSCINENLSAYMNMATDSISLTDLRNAECFVSFFLDGNYKYAPLTHIIKEAASKDIPYYQIGWIKDTTSRFARHRFIPSSGNYEELLNKIISNLNNSKNDNAKMNGLIETLSETKKSVFVIGPEIMSLSNCNLILDKINKITKLTGSNVYMPNQYGNLHGLLALADVKPISYVQKKIDKGEIDLLWLIGETPFDERPDVKFIVYQNSFPPPKKLVPDVILPTSLWGETEGSYLNSDGIIKKSKAVAVQHEYSLPHEKVFSRIAKSAKIKRLKFSSKNISKEFHQKKKTALKKSTIAFPNSEYPYLLVQENAQHIYSGLNLSKGIEGLGELVKTDHIIINPGDARKQKLENGEIVQLVSKENEMHCSVQIRKTISQGVILLIFSNGHLEYESNPCPVKIRREHV